MQMNQLVLCTITDKIICMYLRFCACTKLYKILVHFIAWLLYALHHTFVGT